MSFLLLLHFHVYIRVRSNIKERIENSFHTESARGKWIRYKTELN